MDAAAHHARPSRRRPRRDAPAASACSSARISTRSSTPAAMTAISASSPGSSPSRKSGRAVSPALRPRNPRLRRRGGGALPEDAVRFVDRGRRLRGRHARPDRRRGRQDRRCAARLRRRPGLRSPPRPIAAPTCVGYLEVHIEQGPVLERAGEPLGVVTAIASQGRYRLSVEGEAGHAGTVPMALRHDALAAAAETLVDDRGGRQGRARAQSLVATVGEMTRPARRQQRHPRRGPLQPRRARRRRRRRGAMRSRKSAAAFARSAPAAASSSAWRRCTRSRSRSARRHFGAPSPRRSKTSPASGRAS